MNQQEVEEALRLLNDGDQAGFTFIYEAYATLILTYAMEFLGSREDAEDIVADTFSRLWASRGHFDVIEKVLAFLHVTAYHACVDCWRRKRAEAGRMAELENNAETFYEIKKEQDPIEENLKRLIDAEVRKLAKRDQQIFKMSFLDGASNSEIANSLRISEKTVRNRKVVIRKKLRLLSWGDDPAKK